MEYEIVVHRHARRDVMQVYQRAAKNAPEAAEKWLDRLQDKIRTLQVNPERCPNAGESSRVDISVLEILFGRRPNVFRVIFTIDGSRVRVLRFLRGQRRKLTRQQIMDALDDES